MKVILIQARAGQAAGTAVELEDSMAIEAITSGAARTEADHAAIQARDTQIQNMQARQKASDLKKIDAALARAVTRRAIVPKGDGQKALDTVKATMTQRFEAGTDVDTVCELIDYIPGEADVTLTNRVTAAAHLVEGQDGFRFERVTSQGVSLEAAGKGYVTAREPMNKLIREGKWLEARKLSAESALIMKHDIMGQVKAGDDFLLRDVIKAADFTDPDSQVGTLATGLVLMRNLGFLVNKLNFLPYISTDLSSEAARFGQPIFTRYITPPDVLTYVPGVGFTSDATAISNAGVGTTQSGGTTQTSGTVTKSVPAVTDRTVTMNMFKGVEIEFGVNKLASTMRNLFSEQRDAQLYSLGEAIAQHFLATLFAATWTGSKTVVSSPLADWNLKSLIRVKNYLSINKVPDMGRFLLLHSFYHDKLLEDSNLLSAQAILSLINRDASSFNVADLPKLFGIKPLESQLAAAGADGTLSTWTDETAPPAKVGFAGNISSMLFVSRPPQDYTKTAQDLGVPLTAAVELVTEPESGLTVMVFKYADNGKMSISQRVCVMWGAAQGDPRQGMFIQPNP